MSTLQSLVDDFLSQQRIAVAGVSRSEVSSPANLIYRKLRATGHRVFAINPRADSVEGDPCYPALNALPERVDGVVLVTPPEATEALVEECSQLGIPRVWMHRSLGAGSVSERAVAACREKNISVIAGGCPMMYCAPVDFGHKCMRWVLGVTGNLPK